ncbi:MAG: right-handed parallel beta-helix repeat-containing protein [Candidatus Krumholzibacteria bacterium]|nr:right-handed parallel beta-helix repeat-containing protein [Candidatus Krumholzibacteria bacterium]
MKAATVHALVMPALLVALVSVSSCESKVEIANAAPGNVTLSVSKCFIETGGTVTFSGGAIDDDGDSLTFRWTATAGSFTPASATGASVEWTAPSTPGSVTIRMAVTDDIETVARTQSITVCTPIQGSVTTSTTIANTGFIYIVKNADLLQIASDATLTIEPGVTIVFDRALGGFEAFGRIVAEGTPAEEIRFRGNSCGASSSLWDGVYVDGGHGEAIFRNVDLSSSSNGIQVVNGGKLTLDSCKVHDNNNIGISITTELSVAHIISSEIWDNGVGVEIENASVDITSSAIQYNGSNGIEISYSLSETDVTIDSTTIANNEDNGIRLSNLAAPVIRDCSISSNGPESGGGYAILLAAYASSDTIDAQYNFWGLGNTTEGKIEDLIFDGNDPGGFGYVDFRHYLLIEPPWVPKAGPAGGAKER